jgi:hypothetical protein
LKYRINGELTLKMQAKKLGVKLTSFFNCIYFYVVLSYVPLVCSGLRVEPYIRGI